MGACNLTLTHALSPPSHDAGADSAVVCNHHGLGGAGAAHLAAAVVEACNKPSEFKFLYDPNLPIKVWISVD